MVERLIKAPPGVPAGELVAQGQVDLGFQQLSELLHVPGIEVVGSLPRDIQAETVFSAGVGKRSLHPQEVTDLIAFLSSSDGDRVKREHGMDPA